jgi:hypothetical protein
MSAILAKIAALTGFAFYMAGMACWAFLFSVVFGRFA